MYNFILNCWRLQKITAEDVQAFAAKGFITAGEAEQIIAA